MFGRTKYPCPNDVNPELFLERSPKPEMRERVVERILSKTNSGELLFTGVYTNNIKLSDLARRQRQSTFAVTIDEFANPQVVVEDPLYYAGMGIYRALFVYDCRGMMPTFKYINSTMHWCANSGGSVQEHLLYVVRNR